ncbi:transcriptional regulator, IclR family [Tistlia consotensis]|uniref:Transcriptional regulator, IclR family n=1 Tax=Tistlia consotensis USBA 355 TaxID=560819 RepID=A0A1Y6CD01_9PROT|nr:IclR family transcriptional regulator [Tistlia consotensis]SMF57070.1 transcriptional regulator, IclR family [Tistlia consotensis USBA 355]SNR45304.1 transcriptional regulator, IclR family [Tistlia consotensis]
MARTGSGEADGKRGGKTAAGGRARSGDPLMVLSVEKAFRVLDAFDAAHPTMSLTQLAAAVGLDKSAAQRFAHTLERLGYLRKDPETKRFELTVKTLDLGAHFMRANWLVERATPYLMHLSKTTEETINLTVPDGAELVFVSRFLSRHVLNTDVVIGSRMPLYCTAPGIALLSRLPRGEALALLERCELKPYTPQTTWRLEDLLAKIELSAARGYATAFEEFYRGDLSVAAAILDAKGRPIGALNIATSSARFQPAEAEERFAPLVVAAALSISQASQPPG